MTGLTFSEPAVPQISIKSRSDTEIVLSWEKEKETKEHGAASYYLLKIIKLNEKSEMRITEEEMKIPNLAMCSKYCFRLSSGNDAGSSEFSTEKCSHTLAPSKIKLFLGENVYRSDIQNQEL